VKAVIDSISVAVEIEKLFYRSEDLWSKVSFGFGWKKSEWRFAD
jgi:hypothetical protein